MVTGGDVEKRVFLDLQRSISKPQAKDTAALQDTERHILYSKYLTVGKYGLCEGSGSEQRSWMHSEPIRLEIQKAAMRSRFHACSRYGYSVFNNGIDIYLILVMVLFADTLEQRMSLSRLVFNRWRSSLSNVEGI